MAKDKKTYKNFAIALKELKEKADVSYEKIALGIYTGPEWIHRGDGWVYDIFNYRKPGYLPTYKIIKLFTDYFKLPVDYFYEYRLRKLKDTIDKNRKFLNILEKLMIKYKNQF